VRSYRLAFLLSIPITCAAQIPAGFGATPIFDEEFNGSSLDTSVWTYRTGVRDQCLQVPNAVTVAHGYARISIYSGEGDDGKPANYCGSITTKDHFLHSYGYWEAAVRYQYQPAIQCAWWIQSPTIGRDVDDPQRSGVEFDIFEHTSGNLKPEGFDHALHWNGYKQGVHKPLGHNGTLRDLNDGKFHVFGFGWTPGAYTFYVNGQVEWTVTSAEAPISAAPEFVILDVELPARAKVPAGGYGPLGSPQNAYLDVDYVRVYPYAKR
jgi:beta-glucanase (GH16 family)